MAVTDKVSKLKGLGEKMSGYLKEKKAVDVVHGGSCPDGFIYDHDQKSKTYGRCIPLGSGTLVKK